MNAARDLSRLAAVVGIGVLAFLPMARLPAFYDSFLYIVFFWVSLSTSWALLSGFAGYFSLGHAAFFGLGLYATADLTTKFGWPFLATLPVAAALPALLALGIGAAYAGVAGTFIALIATLAPAQIWAYLGVVFAVVIIGRLGNPLGALLAGMLIGASESLAMAVLSPAWAPVVSFSVLIVILLWDPDWL